MNFSKMKIGSRIIAGYSVPIFIMALVVVLVYSKINYLIGTFTQVGHTQEVIDRGNNLAKLLDTVETGEWVFLNTDKNGYLEPYISGLKAFEDKLSGLEELISDNPDQVAMLRVIHDLSREWINLVAAHEIAERRKVEVTQKNLNYHKVFLAEGEGKEILDNLHLTIEALQTNLKRVEDHKGLELAISTAKDMVDWGISERGFLITEVDEFFDPFKNDKKSFQNHLEQLKDHFSGQVIYRSMAKNLRLVNRIEDLSRQWKEKIASTKIMVRDEFNNSELTINEGVTLIGQGKANNVKDKLREKIDEFVGIERSFLEKRRVEVEIKASEAKLFTVGGSVIAIILSVIISIYMSRSITRPIIKVVDMVKDIAEKEGDLTKLLNIDTQDDIDEIISVFSDISDQTKLLALNAAAGAERVGEENTGFADVVDEARKLAESTTKASAELASIITGTAKDTSGAVTMTEEGTSQVKTKTELAEKAGESLNKIVRAVNEVQTKIELIVPV